MTDEQKADDKIKVVFVRASRGLKAGATRTLPVEQAQTLIAQGHARKA